MEKQSVVITEVEDFIRDFENGTQVVSPKGNKMKYWIQVGTYWFGIPKKKYQSFPDALGNAIADYQKFKEMKSELQLQSAFHLLDLIQLARAHHLLEDAKQETRNYLQEIEQLKKELADCRKLNNKLAQENKILHNLLPPSKKGKTQVGDVSA
jgi:hypothetical protein